MARGKRKFVVEITETRDLTGDELAKSLSRLAGGLSSGRNSIEHGVIRDSGGTIIGRYSWMDQLIPPKRTEP